MLLGGFPHRLSVGYASTAAIVLVVEYALGRQISRPTCGAHRSGDLGSVLT